MIKVKSVKQKINKKVEKMYELIFQKENLLS